MTFRRRFIARVLAALPLVIGALATPAEAAPDPLARPSRRWFEAALRMRRLAERAGDQPNGAVLVIDDRLVGEGPSRVVELGDATAHAERVAIRDAQRRLGRTDLRGSILVSTSRPCAACEAAAALAGVSRMFYGEELRDAGAPKA
jgi:tRNA(Arg) A34 adenosine deaminase TadA